MFLYSEARNVAEGIEATVLWLVPVEFWIAKADRSNYLRRDGLTRQL